MGEHIQSNEECKNGHEGLHHSHILQLNCEEATPTLNHPSECLLQRIDHLDDILSTMEDKSPTERSTSPSATSPRTTSRRHSSAPTTPSGLERRRRPTEFVLEEVQEKGTLVERISDLEKRVMTLQHMLPSKSTENPSGFPHRRVMSHQETYGQQMLQEPIDVEKHEVTTLSHSDPSEHKGHPEPFVDSISPDAYVAKSESPHVKHHEDMISSGKATDAESNDPRVPKQVSKKKSLKIRNWLSKRLHINLPGTPQVETR